MGGRVGSSSIALNARSILQGAASLRRRRAKTRQQRHHPDSARVLRGIRSRAPLWVLERKNAAAFGRGASVASKRVTERTQPTHRRALVTFTRRATRVGVPAQVRKPCPAPPRAAAALVQGHKTSAPLTRVRQDKARRSGCFVVAPRRPARSRSRRQHHRARPHTTRAQKASQQRALHSLLRAKPGRRGPTPTHAAPHPTPAHAPPIPTGDAPNEARRQPEAGRGPASDDGGGQSGGGGHGTGRWPRRAGAPPPLPRAPRDGAAGRYVLVCVNLF